MYFATQLHRECLLSLVRPAIQKGLDCWQIRARRNVSPSVGRQGYQMQQQDQMANSVERPTEMWVYEDAFAVRSASVVKALDRLSMKQRSVTGLREDRP